MGDSSTDGMTLISSKPVVAANPPQVKPGMKETVITARPAPPKQTVSDEQTIMQAPIGGGEKPSASGSRSPATKGSSGSSSYAGLARNVVISVTEQDLIGEGLLQQAPRMDFKGRKVPSLGGIPLISKLGQGGMGAVYYGIHPGLQIEVAVKVLPLALAQPEAIQRFYREAQIAAKIQSPHLVAVRDVNQEHGLYYLVMEYINGMTSGGHLKKMKEKGSTGLPERDALSICIAATEGLAVAHNAAIIHRDIKPDNILVPTYRGKEELDFNSARLSDLGLARQEQGEGLTVTAVGLGTAGYMAPEQAMNARTVGKAADIWSMGATLYALIAGRAPFKGDTPVNTIVASVQDPHEPITNLRADVSVVTQALIDCCLDKKAEGRFPDGAALLEGMKVCRDVLGASEAVQKEALQALSQLQKAKEKGEKVVGVAVSGSKHFSFQKSKASQDSSKTVMLAGIAAGVVLLLAAGAFFAFGNRGNNNGGGGNSQVESAMMAKLAEMERKLQARENELASQAKKREEELDKMMKAQEDAINKRLEESKKQLAEERKKLENDPKQKEKELAFESLGFASAKAAEGDVDSAQKHLDEAAKALPAEHALIVSMRQTIEQKRDSIKKAAAEQKRKHLVADLNADVASLDKGGDLSEVSSKITAAIKAYPADPEMIALSERVERKRSDLEKNQQQQKLAGERTAAVKAADPLIKTGELALAEKKLVELEQRFAGDTEVGRLRKAFDARKQEEGRRAAEEAKRISDDKKAGERIGLLKLIDGHLDDKKTNLAEAEKGFSELAAKFPDDGAVKATRDRIDARKKELDNVASETKRVENLNLAVKDLESAVASGADLAALQTKIAAVEKFGTNDALAQVKQKLAARIAEKKKLEEDELRKKADADKAKAEQKTAFDSYVRSADGILSRAGATRADVIKAEENLRAAERLFPTDPALPALRQKLQAAQAVKPKANDDPATEGPGPKTAPPAKRKRIGEENVD